MTRPERITAWLLRSEYERFQKGTAEYGAVSNRKHYLNDVPLVPYSEAREAAVRELVKVVRWVVSKDWQCAAVPAAYLAGLRRALDSVDALEEAD